MSLGRGVDFVNIADTLETLRAWGTRCIFGELISSRLSWPNPLG